MVARSYSGLTIKKLYSRAGNICSHQDCDQQLITDDGTNVSDISHIEGGEPGSPRYNPELALEQLNDYENLIVMCKIHNKIIDSDEKTYTVEYLKDMKKKHEESMKDKEYQISDEEVVKIIQTEQEQINIQTGTGTQIVAQGKNVTQNVGITSMVDVEHLFGILFKQNSLQIKEESQLIAKESAEKYCKTFIEKANSQLSTEDIKKMSDPDVQYVLTKSIIESGRRDEDDLREHLSMLMVERIKHSDQNLKRIVYNEAIETIPKLTHDELKIIALCFTLRYTRRLAIKHIDELDNFLKLLEPLYDFNNTNAEFQHIEYAGCGGIGIGTWNYANSLGDSYPELFPLTISSDHLVGHNIPSEIMQDIFTTINDKEFKFKIINEKELNSYLDSQSVEVIIANEIRSQFSTAKQEQKRKINELIKNLKEIQKVNEIISNSNLRYLTLTSVGIVIGAMYYEKTTGEKIPIDVWIN